MSVIVATVYRDGLIVGSDTLENSGILTDNRSIDPFVKINEKMIFFGSGSRNSINQIGNSLKTIFFKNFSSFGEEMCLRSLGQYLRSLYKSNFKNENVSMAIVGHDFENGSQLYLISSGGTILNPSFFLIGATQNYLNDFCDSNFKTGMSFSQAYEFIYKTLIFSTYRKNGVECILRLCRINEFGISRKKILPYSNKIDKLVTYKKNFEIFV